MAGKNLTILVNENWIGKSEFANVFRQDRDLLRRMSPGIAWIGSDRIDRYEFGFGSFHQGRNASSLIRCQARVFACVLLLGTAQTTRFQFHIDLLFPKKAVDRVRRAHDGDSRLNRLRNVA